MPPSVVTTLSQATHFSYLCWVAALPKCWQHQHLLVGFCALHEVTLETSATGGIGGQHHLHFCHSRQAPHLISGQACLALKDHVDFWFLVGLDASDPGEITTLAKGMCSLFPLAGGERDLETIIYPARITKNQYTLV